MEVNPSVPAKTLPEFIAYAKANPGKDQHGFARHRNLRHVSGELFKMMAGINMVHVPYRGAAPAIIDLLGGQVQILFDTMARSIEYIRAGNLRAASRDDRNALGSAAGHSDRGRFRAGLRGDCLVRHRRSQKHAGRHHREA